MEAKRNCGRVTFPWEGSAERSRGPRHRNRMRGGADQGGWATDHKALMVKDQATSIRRSCGERSMPYLGISCLTLERATTAMCGRSKKSAEAVVSARMQSGREGRNSKRSTNDDESQR
jgi:hypothetical protein